MTLSGNRTAAPSDAMTKHFVCTEQGCGKSFARREHLHRHEFNHKDADFTCPRCAAHFRRRDLLERHTQRHRQKDAEAGGEGLGNLATRKRLWRDSHGRVMNSSRPHKLSASSLDSHTTAARRSDGPANGFSYALPTPSASNSTAGSDQMNNEQGVDVTYLQDPWQSIDMGFVPQPEGTDLDFLSDSSWSNQAFQGLIGAPCDLPHNDISFPDTTMSFSTSLPTLQYYSWLFGHGNPDADTSHAQPLLGTTSQADINLSQPIIRTTAEADINHSQPLSGTTFQADLLTGHIRDEFPVDGMPSYLSPSNQGGTSELGMIGLDSPHLYFSPSRQPTNIAHTSAHVSHNLLAPDACIKTSPTKAPVVTNEARDGLMQLISQARPVRPNRSEVTSSDPLLSLLALQQYSDLFFERFNSTYPLIHAATFQSSMVHPLLLMSVVLLGATYGDKEAHLLAVCIHDIMRPLIHGSKEFGPRPKLWMLQTILLVECFGKSRAGENQHDMSNIYHGLQINLLRRSDCHNANIPAWDESAQSLEEYWRTAIEAEEKRRLAMISFMWDTQHAIFFAQILCLNASELKVTLPWDTAIWEATTARDWLHLARAAPAPQQYLSVLQMYTDASVSSAPLHLNALSRVLIFHGLMSLSWDFRRRDQTALNRDTPSNGVRWQTTISACYAKWKTDFDRYTKDVLLSLSNDAAQYATFQRYAVANSAVYHTAQLILEVETADLQIHAGAKHITGRPVTDLDRQRSRARLNEFMTREEGKSVGRATWHAARLIRDGVRKLDNWNVDDMIHFPWCLYLATLTCWATYSTAVERCRGDRQRSIYAPVPENRGVDDEDDDWDSRTDMKALISALSRLDPTRDTFAKDIWSVAENCKPHGLLTCMVKHLSTTRWAVIREGTVVLKDLVAPQVR